MRRSRSAIHPPAGGRRVGGGRRGAPPAAPPPPAPTPAPRRAPPPAPAGVLRAGGGNGRRLPRRPRRARLHGDPDAEDRRVGDRERRGTVPARLLRPTCVPRAEPE